MHAIQEVYKKYGNHMKFQFQARDSCARISSVSSHWKSRTLQEIVPCTAAVFYTQL